MDKFEKIDLGKTNVTVREMTVQEVENFIEGRDNPPAVVCADMLLHGHIMDSVALQRCSDLTPESIKALLPSELSRVADKAKELNSFFVGLLERIRAQMEQAVSEKA